MNIFHRQFLLLLFTLIVITFACKKEKEPAPPVTGSLITGSPSVVGVSDAMVSGNTENTLYQITLPAGTDIKLLKLNVPIISGATISPDPATPRDYTNAVEFTITSADGRKQVVKFEVTVTAPKSSAKQISSFSFNALNPVVNGIIDQAALKITASVPTETDITKLAPTIVLSEKASVTPASGIAQDFTAPVIFKVTAEDGSTQSYEITVVPLAPKDSLMAYFSFDKDDYRNDSGPEIGGTPKGNAGFADGIKGRCLLLDGSGDYVDLGRAYQLTDEFTITTWINPDETTRSDAAIFAKYESNNYGPYDFYLNYDRANIWISDGFGSYKSVSSKAKIPAKTWTHLAWVGSKKSVKLYINGVLDIEAAIPGMTQNNDLVTIGRQAFLFNTNGNLEFKGKIDELRIYNRALENEEVLNFSK